MQVSLNFSHRPAKCTASLTRYFEVELRTTFCFPSPTQLKKHFIQRHVLGRLGRTDTAFIKSRPYIVVLAVVLHLVMLLLNWTCRLNLFFRFRWSFKESVLHATECNRWWPKSCNIWDQWYCRFIKFTGKVCVCTVFNCCEEIIGELSIREIIPKLGQVFRTALYLAVL